MQQMYVPGKIADGKSVIIDIGTGYFIQKVGDIQQ
jgi:prefoldin subunit 5